MIEPNNPQDHGFGIAGTNAGVWTMDGDSQTNYEAALAEAIHQTFERDEKLAQARIDLRESFETDLAVWSVAKPHPSYTKGSGYRKVRDTGDHIIDAMAEPVWGKHPYDPMGIKPAADPQTEIDRQARLIVDSEYRRRREAQTND